MHCRLASTASWASAWSSCAVSLCMLSACKAACVSVRVEHKGGGPLPALEGGWHCIMCLEMACLCSVFVFVFVHVECL